MNMLVFYCVIFRLCAGAHGAQNALYSTGLIAQVRCSEGGMGSQ